MDSIDRLRACRCGACGGAIGRRVNLVQVPRKPKWQYPVAGNVLTGYGPAAVAVLCDQCVADERSINECLELRGEEYVYHPVRELEEIPPEPGPAMSDAPDPWDTEDWPDASYFEDFENLWGDEDDDFEDEEEDALDRAYEECGYSPELGACTLGGTEHCDFECPFRDHPEIWFGEEE